MATISTLKPVQDVGNAFRKFIQDQDLTDGFKDDVTADYLRGERKLGEFWKERPKNEGARGRPNKQRGSLLEPRSNPPTLSELGLAKKRAARDLTFADVEETFFEKCIVERRANEDLSVFGVYADIKREPAGRGGGAMNRWKTDPQYWYFASPSKRITQAPRFRASKLWQAI